jgi:hypothetical protein
MTTMTLRSTAALLVWIGAIGPAIADPRRPQATPGAAETSSSSRHAPRNFVSDQTVSPGYWHVAAEVARVAGPELNPETPYRLGDYTRLALDGRLALGERHVAALFDVRGLHG